MRNQKVLTIIKPYPYSFSTNVHLTTDGWGKGEGQEFSLCSLKKHCSPDKRMMVTRVKMWVWESHGNSYCTKKIKQKFRFFGCSSSLWYLQISIWNMIIFAAPTLLPWVKMTELFFTPRPFVGNVAWGLNTPSSLMLTWLLSDHSHTQRPAFGYGTWGILP